jgi:hypothetical protein
LSGVAAGSGDVRCEECGREADNQARGWRALLAVESEADGSLYVVTYCPECAEREFGSSALGQ